MSQAKAASDALDLAFTRYKQCKNLLEKALGATPQNERSITNKMKSIADSLQEVNSCHTSWASKSGLNDTELSAADQKYRTSWLEGLWSDVNDLQEQVDTFLEKLYPPTAPGAQELEIIKGQFESLKIDITSRFTVLLTKTNPENQALTPSSLKVYEGLFTEVRNLFTLELQTLTNNMAALDLANSSKATTN